MSGTQQCGAKVSPSLDVLKAFSRCSGVQLELREWCLGFRSHEWVRFNYSYCFVSIVDAALGGSAGSRPGHSAHTCASAQLTLLLRQWS